MNTIIEKIRAEVERRIQQIKDAIERESDAEMETYFSGKVIALEEFDFFLSTLEKEEKPMNSNEGLEDILLEFYDEYDSNVENRPIVPRIYAEKLACHFAQWGVEHTREQSKPKVCEGLDEEIERYQEKHFEYNSEFDSIRLKGDYLPSPQTLADIARHFYELGRQSKEQPVCEECPSRGNTHTYLKGLEDGKKEMREKMLKEAVEGVICGYTRQDGEHTFAQSDYLPKGIFKPGDSVKLIIIKED